MKDNYGDKIEVNSRARTGGSGYVAIDFISSPGEADTNGITMILTPAKARKLARKINRHASRIEIAERNR